MGEERVCRYPEPIREDVSQICTAVPVDTKGKLTNVMGTENAPPPPTVRGRDGLYDPVVHSTHNE